MFVLASQPEINCFLIVFFQLELIEWVIFFKGTLRHNVCLCNVLSQTHHLVSFSIVSRAKQQIDFVYRLCMQHQM